MGRKRDEMMSDGPMSCAAAQHKELLIKPSRAPAHAHVKYNVAAEVVTTATRLPLHLRAKCARVLPQHFGFELPIPVPTTTAMRC